MTTRRGLPAGSGSRCALLAALTLLLAGMSTATVLAGTDPWPGGARQGRAGIAGTSIATLGPAHASAWGFAPGDRTEPDDAMRFLTLGMRARVSPNRRHLAATGLLAFAGQVGAVYDLGNGYVKHLMNPRAFGFQIHFDLAASLRHPGNGFVISRRF
ncbi:MAG: hypothetical protein ACYDIE_08375 [Candidatus Krumholzibacteriia bacterium]